MSRGKVCSECGRVPVSGKTWSLLMAADDRLRILSAKLKQAKGIPERIAAYLEENADWNDGDPIQKTLRYLAEEIRKGKWDADR